MSGLKRNDISLIKDTLNLAVSQANNALNVNILTGGGGGGGGGGGVVQGISTGTGGGAVDISATANRLLVSVGKTNANPSVDIPLLTTPAGNLIVEAKTHDGTNNPIASTVANNVNWLNVNVLSTIRGSYNNIINNITLPANTSLPVEGLTINNEYGNESVISYQDSTFAATSFISIYGSFASTNNADENANPTWFYIGVLQPAVIRTNCRQASSVLKLKGLKRIRIRNEGAADVASVLCTLFSG